MCVSCHPRVVLKRCTSQSVNVREFCFNQCIKRYQIMVSCNTKINFSVLSKVLCAIGMVKT